MTLKQALLEYQVELIKEKLIKNNWNIKQTALELDCHICTVYKALRYKKVETIS